MSPALRVELTDLLKLITDPYFTFLVFLTDDAFNVSTQPF